MIITQGSLVADVPRALDAERFETLANMPGTRIERIVSTGQTTPDGEWYDQGWDEWVMVVTGSAKLQIEGEPSPRDLTPGGWLLLPRRVRHRVVWTDPNTPTVWLAIHSEESPGCTE